MKFFQSTFNYPTEDSMNNNINPHIEQKIRRVKKEYNSLYDVLMEALQQAQSGKGAERHQQYVDEPFENQQICEIARRVGVGFNTGQAVKKSYETHGYEEDEVERKVKELLGAINYIAGAIIVLREEN